VRFRMGVVASVVAFGVPGTARAAAPNYIIVSGPSITVPVVLDDVYDNLALVAAVASAPQTSADLQRRPKLDLAGFFWNSPALPRPSNPAEATEHGVFYPAVGTRGAIIVMTSGSPAVPRTATAQVLEILVRHGVPVRDDDPQHSAFVPAKSRAFTITPKRVLPGSCASAAVARHVTNMIGNFNAGNASSFASGFTPGGWFEPYSGRPAGRLLGVTPSISKQIVSARSALGDRWTALRLQPPTGQTVRRSGNATYELALRVSADGQSFEEDVKVVVTCSTGKISKWLGPAWRAT
jgi:hypothetical protein